MRFYNRKFKAEGNIPGDDYLSSFKPLQVEIKGGSKDDFERGLRLFRNIVNKEGVLADYKAHQTYEKPSEKKRRKRREAAEKRIALEIKQRKFEEANKE